MPDHTHVGFDSFLSLIDTYRPQYLLHGHVHQQYTRNNKREMMCGDTTLINVCGTYILEIPDPPADRIPKENMLQKAIKYIKIHYLD